MWANSRFESDFLPGAVFSYERYEPEAFRDEGMTIGLQAGYGVVLGGAYVAIEGGVSANAGVENLDADFGGMRYRTNFSTIEVNEFQGFSSKLNGSADLSVRLGYPMGRWMPFVGGGLAVGFVETTYVRATSTRTTDSFSGEETLESDGLAFKDSEVVGGYGLGAGSEYALTDRIALRAEYRFVDLGKTKLDIGDGEWAEIDNRHQEAKIGLSYRF